MIADLVLEAMRRGGTQALFAPICWDPGGDQTQRQVVVEAGVGCDAASAVSEPRGDARARLLASAEETGPHPGSRMDILALHMLGAMSEEQLGRLGDALGRLAESTDGFLDMATLCSGSDLIVPVFKQVWSRIEQKIGKPLPAVRHVFAVEKVR